MNQPLWSLSRDKIPDPVNPLELWKRYQAQSKANLREIPSLEDAEIILNKLAVEPLLPWSERALSRIRSALRAGRRGEEVQP